MKIVVTLISCLVFIACNQSNKNSKPTDPLTAGRYFIDASLKGDYKEARNYLLVDSLNLMYFDRISDFYLKMKPEEKEGYKNANIIIGTDGVESVSDSVTIINYSNTFKNMPSKIKVVKVNGDWLVDFKYTFSGNL